MTQQKQFDLPRSNLHRLANMTPREYYSRKGECRVTAQQYGAGSRKGFQRSRPKNPIYYNEARCSVVCPSGIKRYTYIRFYGPPDPKTPVWVWCSCEDFAYRLEWVLTQIGCSTISAGYSERGTKIINKPPDIKNPQRKPGLCKHLLVASQVALRRTKDFASEMGQKEQPTKEARTSGFNAQPGQIITFK